MWLHNGTILLRNKMSLKMSKFSSWQIRNRVPSRSITVHLLYHNKKWGIPDAWMQARTRRFGRIRRFPTSLDRTNLLKREKSNAWKNHLLKRNLLQKNSLKNIIKKKKKQNPKSGFFLRDRSCNRFE